MERVQTYQVVGYQNSGKTTLMEKLISSGKKSGFRIGTIKHHGHGGKLEQASTKDSDKHFLAGAQVSAVEGEGTLQIVAEHSIKWPLDEILRIYQNFPLDLILIEGYKFAPYPKIVLIRDESDLVLLEELENIIAIIAWVPVEVQGKFEVFSIKDSDLFVEVFFNVFLNN